MEVVLAEFETKYVRNEYDRFALIVAIHNGLKGGRWLYKRAAGETYVSPVIGECHVGMGHGFWRLLADTLYDHQNCVEDNVRLAAFATRLAIRYASGVGDPVQVVSYTFGDQFWESRKPAEMQSLELHFPLREFQDAIQNYWRMTSPPTRVEQVKKYGVVGMPGDELTFLMGVKVEWLQTVANRNKFEGFVYGNRDNLHKRALKEQARGQEVRNKNQQP